MPMQEQKVAQQVPLEEKIAQLENKKARLVTHRDELESKIQRLVAKTAAESPSGSASPAEDAQRTSG